MLTKYFKEGQPRLQITSVRIFKLGFLLRSFLTQEELHEILALLQGQYREVATFMAYTGLDVSDVLKLEWSSVDMKAKMIRTERRKMKHNAKTIKLKIPMNQMVEAVLRNRSRSRNLHDKRIFQVCGATHFRRVRNLQQNWKRACNKSSVDWHIRPKDLRHFFGSHLLNSDVDPLMIASFMGPRIV